MEKKDDIAEMDQKKLGAERHEKVKLGLDQLDSHYIFAEDNENFEKYTISQRIKKSKKMKNYQSNYDFIL